VNDPQNHDRTFAQEVRDAIRPLNHVAEIASLKLWDNPSGKWGKAQSLDRFSVAKSLLRLLLV
jgi:hypothetical protein